MYIQHISTRLLRAKRRTNVGPTRHCTAALLSCATKDALLSIVVAHSDPQRHSTPDIDVIRGFQTDQAVSVCSPTEDAYYPE